jgi:hypothetical protein
VKPLLVIDGDSFAHRAYHALPKTILRKGGRPAGAILGFANFLLRFYQAEQPRAVLVGWDTLDEPTYRNEQFPAYQSGREFDDALVAYLQWLGSWAARSPGTSRTPSIGTSNLFGGLSNFTIVNQGTISADVSGMTLRVQGGTLTNQGTLEAKNGGTLTLANMWSNAGTINAANSTVNLGGVFTTAGLNLPAFVNTGGTVNLTGTLDNTGTTLALNAATGSWNLAGGTIKNGTLTASGGSKLIFTTSGGTLDRGLGFEPYAG